MTKTEAEIIKRWVETKRENCLEVVKRYTSDEKSRARNIPFIKMMVDRAEAFDTVHNALTLQIDLEKINEQEEKN
jgi:hypothetical protein